MTDALVVGRRSVIAAGETALVRRLQSIARSCHRTRVAVIGYSQGAGVVSAAIRELDDRTRRSVAAVVLYADPYSAGATPYAITLSPPQSANPAPQRIGRGALGVVPIPMAGRVRDICFAGDLVCDQAPTLPSQLAQALVSPVHTAYKSCWRRGRTMTPPGGALEAESLGYAEVLVEVDEDAGVVVDVADGAEMAAPSRTP